MLNLGRRATDLSECGREACVSPAPLAILMWEREFFVFHMSSRCRTCHPSFSDIPIRLNLELWMYLDRSG